MGTFTYTIPTAGVTLNSIADPEIATALQTLLTWGNGNIDTNNLSSTAAIKGSQLAPNAAIAGSQLAASAGIAGSQLASNAGITGGQIASNAGITGGQLASNAGILGSQLSASAGITVGQLAAGALSWLSFTSAGTSVSALSGQFVKATAVPITVTLPAPASNALVGVEAGTSATGANPVTVATSGGVINGAGVSAASSVLLGTSGAYVILQSDGTNWYVIAGQQDTGWVNLTLGTNIIAGAGTPQGRLVGNRISLRGDVTNNTGGNITTGYVLATYPAALKGPISALMPVVPSQTDRFLGIYVQQTNVVLNVWGASTPFANATSLRLDSAQGVLVD